MAARPTTLIKDAVQADRRGDRAKVTSAITEIVTYTRPSVAWLPIAAKCCQLLDSPTTALPTMTGPESGRDDAFFERVKQFRNLCRADFDRAVKTRLEQLKQQAPKADALHALARLCVAKEMFDSPKTSVTFLVHGGLIVDNVDVALDI